MERPKFAPVRFEPLDRFDYCWTVDFPIYEWNEEEKKIDFTSGSRCHRVVDRRLSL
jgi:aspartyl-tRNA synthetase